MQRAMSGDYEARRAFFAAARDVFLRARPRRVGRVAPGQRRAVPAHRDRRGRARPRAGRAQRCVGLGDVPGVGTVKQFGHAYQLEHHDVPVPTSPPAAGEHTASVLTSVRRTHERLAARGDHTLRYPLDGIRVLDYGTALAGPFGPMVLSDLGADVIKIDPIDVRVGTEADATYAACQRGKRSIAIDLKSEDGRQVSRDLIASADVVHYNLRTGVAERLGFGYEQAKTVNPRIVHCHVTSYGNTGPLARWPGVDQMGQAIAGHEYEQGATPNGGHPTWYRFGMCDATAGMFSIIGVLQALRERDRTGQAQQVAADILSGAMFLASDAFVGPDTLATRPHLDRLQMGLGPRYRLYETADGWLCIAAVRDDHWRALCVAIGQPDLALDGDALAKILEDVFASKTAADLVRGPRRARRAV